MMNHLATTAILLMSATFVVPVYAQESVQPVQPNLLLQMSRPEQSNHVDSTTRNDIADRPARPNDSSLQAPFRLYVGVGDPRCQPGEDGLGMERPRRRR